MQSASHATAIPRLAQSHPPCTARQGLSRGEWPPVESLESVVPGPALATGLIIVRASRATGIVGHIGLSGLKFHLGGSFGGLYAPNEAIEISQMTGEAL